MLRESSNSEMPSIVCSPEPKTSIENTENSEYLNEVQTILDQVNQIFYRLANKDGGFAKKMMPNIEALESLIKERAPKLEFNILLINIKTQIKSARLIFTVHESSVTNLCGHVSARIDEFVQG